MVWKLSIGQYGTGDYDENDADHDINSVNDDAWNQNLRRK